MSGDAPPTLVDIHLLGIPVQLAAESAEHFDELTREFLHLAHSDQDVRREVPGRLIAVSDDLRERFSRFSEGPNDALAEARSRGEETIDLHYQVPPEACEAAGQLGDLIDEADEYCATGAHLLTLKTKPGPLAYRRWFLGQFTDQLAGHEPVSFADWRAAHS